MRGVSPLSLSAGDGSLRKLELAALAGGDALSRVEWAEASRDHEPEGGRTSHCGRGCSVNGGGRPSAEVE